MILKSTPKKLSNQIVIVIVMVLCIFVSIIQIALKYNKLISLPPAISVGNIENITALTLDDIYELNNGCVNIVYQTGTNVPREIEGRFTSNTIINQKDAVVALVELRELMQIAEFSFYCYEIVEGVVDGIEVNSFELQQLYDGIPVEGGGFLVTASKNGEPISVRGEFLQLENIETGNIITYQNGLDSMDLEFRSRVKSVQLVISQVDEKGYRLYWKYETGSREILDGRLFYIDALTGDNVIDFPVLID